MSITLQIVQEIVSIFTINTIYLWLACIGTSQKYKI